MIINTKKYIKTRNKINCEYLTINQHNYSKYPTGNYINGPIDLKEFDKLIKINCEYNKITDIINISDTVQYINCKNNNIIKFNCLPDNLETLICDDNKIIVLNNLPSGLIFLSCESNNLIELNNLPLGLIHLSCGINPIENLDYLPSGLVKLFLCGKMEKLKSLNDLPTSIEEFICIDSLEKISKENFPNGLVLFNSQLGIWKKQKK